MKITLRSWRWSLPVCAAFACSPSLAIAQQPLSTVELAQPIDAVGGPALGAVNDDEPLAEAPAAVETAPPIAVPSPEAAGSGSEGIELVKERYANGGIKIEREMSQDTEGNFIPHGIWRQYDEKGRLIAEGKYDHNQRVGLWRRFYRAGEVPLLGTAPYKDFTAPFISQATFDNGLLQGKWIIVDSKQRKVSEIEFVDGQRNGKATWYYPNGALMSQAVYTAGRINGDVVKWSADSSVIEQEVYHAGRKLAPKIEYFADKSKKSEVMYLHAPIAIKTPDDWGTCSLATFESRGQDEKHGPFISWHPNGQVHKQGEFRNNLPVGKVTYWFANGQKELDGGYVDGKQDGPWIWWHENGQKAIAGNYAEGSPVGQWSWWKETGKVAQRADLSNDRAAKTAQPQPQPQTQTRKQIQPQEDRSSGLNETAPADVR